MAWWSLLLAWFRNQLRQSSEHSLSSAKHDHNVSTCSRLSPADRKEHSQWIYATQSINTYNMWQMQTTVSILKFRTLVWLQKRSRQTNRTDFWRRSLIRVFPVAITCILWNLALITNRVPTLSLKRNSLTFHWLFPDQNSFFPDHFTALSHVPPPLPAIWYARIL